MSSVSYQCLAPTQHYQEDEDITAQYIVLGGGSPLDGFDDGFLGDGAYSNVFCGVHKHLPLSHPHKNVAVKTIKKKFLVGTCIHRYM